MTDRSPVFASVVDPDADSPEVRAARPRRLTAHQFVLWLELHPAKEVKP